MGLYKHTKFKSDKIGSADEVASGEAKACLWTRSGTMLAMTGQFQEG